MARSGGIRCDRPQVGRVDLHERNGAAILDGNRGVPHLILERAGALATEKARETGVGVIRVQGIENPGAGAAVAADMAIRPVAALLLGVGPTWSVALPTEEGLPALFDPTFGGETGSLNATMLGPLAAVLAPGDGWVVAALSVTALESLEAFQSRVTGAIAGLETSGSRLLPALWESRRREARANGVSLGSDAWASLQEWAAKLRVELPEGTPANGPPEGR